MDKEALKNVWYDKVSRKYFMEFNSGVQVGIPVSTEPELRDSSDEELGKISMGDLQETLIWEDLDVYISALGAVFHALNGPEFAKYYRSFLGQQGGTARSETKAQAARNNGRKGGRPRKQKSPVTLSQ